MAGGAGEKKVCIVGGGPAGICALRRVLDSPVLTGTMFEQKDDIGGLWNYSGEKTFATSHRNLSTDLKADRDPECITTMYDNLRSNLADALMELGDFKHSKLHNPPFATQPEMHTYLRDYATHFNLWPHVQVNTAVVNIRPENPNAPEGEPGRWIVETHNHKDDKYNTDIYDAVIICTGKNAYPTMPKIPGLDKFTGEIMHLKYYKNVQQIKGRNIVCVGLGPSSRDIGLMLSKSANVQSVTICHKFPGGYHLGLLPPKVREVKNVKLVTSDGVITEEDETIPCDTLILCTGYGLKFPFLHPECGITVTEGKYVPHLHYKAVFTKRPSLAFLNMCYRAPEIKLNEILARYFVGILEGKVKLPPFDEMEAILKAEETEKIEQGVQYSQWFELGNFGTGSWDYIMKLAEELGIKEQYKNVPMWKQLWDVSLSRLFGKTVLYGTDKFIIRDDNKWEYTFSTSPDFPESKAEKVTWFQNPDLTVTVETVQL